MENDLPAPLSAKFKESFAYKTIKDRLPVILARIADTLCRSKSWVKEKYGQEAQEELKMLAGCLSKLRNEEQTNKKLLPLEDGRPDAKVWNDYLHEILERSGEPASWFISPWLYVECYMYRRVQESIEKSVHLKDLDVFMEQKQKALTDSSEAVLILMNYLMSVVDDLDNDKDVDIHKLFKQFIQVSLWGNKCDLSISASMDNAQTSCPLDQVNTLREFVLVDELERVWSYLSEKSPTRIDIILDNAGFEVVTDLCLAEFLLSSKLASSVHFHAKAFPWFVSDVTKADFDHTLQYFSQSNSISMDRFSRKWKERLENGSWNFHVHDFWTMPFEYSKMKKYAADLYKELALASLIIFKGDLNYRKLVQDRNWPATTSFEVSVGGFHPAPFCSLRTLKADVVTGLKDGQAEEVEEKDKQWMTNGNWAVMPFCDKVVA